MFYQSLLTEYNISFNKKLVQINLPVALARDYLSSVALYHELGHFVDQQHSITSVIRYVVNQMPINDKIRIDLLPYFPYLNNSSFDQTLLHHHLGEYFCDLFAAQYVGNTLSIYLDYITSKNNTHSNTHPSTVNRTKVVNDFIANIYNPVIDLLQQVTQHITKNNLYKRSEEVVSNDFYNLIPYDIKNDQELHGIIIYGWNVWLSDFIKFNQIMGYDMDLHNNNIYHVINNLIEKSIGNYFIVNSWQECKNE